MTGRQLHGLDYAASCFGLAGDALAFGPSIYRAGMRGFAAGRSAMRNTGSALRLFARAVGEELARPPQGRAWMRNPMDARVSMAMRAKGVTRVVRKIPESKLLYKPKERGRAPIGPDRNPVELHHLDQDLGNASPRAEMTRTGHRGPGNYSKNHSNTGQSPSKVNRAESGRQHRAHWEQEWDNGRFDNLPGQPK